MAHHLSAVLKNLGIPSKLYNSIVEGVCDMKNYSPLSDASKDDEPEEIEKVLLAHINQELPEETTRIETKPLSFYTLPELLSAAFNHPDMDSDLRVDLWQRICDAKFADIDSPEYIGAMLGMKAENIAGISIAKSSIRQSIRVSYIKQFEEAKEHLDMIMSISDYDKFFVEALISLFGVIKKQPDLDKEDLLLNLQEYVFGHSKGFYIAADEYISRVTNKSPTDEETTEEEPDENEPNNSKGAGSSISSPILEVPQKLAFMGNNQRL